jgi:hypothetical protein
MARLSVRTYGGMMPSANPKNMPEAAAVYAQNLDLRYGDFRPLPAPANIGAAAAGSTLYKFETGGSFITRPGLVNFVRGQIPTDATERTYYTGDGAPKVMTKDGAVRQLGVPSPAAAPLVEVNLTAQYSTDDSAKDQATKQSEILAAIKAGYSWPFVGLTDADLARYIPNGDPAAKWSFSFKMPGVLAGGVFTPTNPAHANLMDDRLGFHLGPLGDGNVYGFSDMDVRGQKIVFANNWEAALAAIADPSDKSGAKKLLNADQIASMKATITDPIPGLDVAYDQAITRLRDLKNQFIAVADTGSPAAAANIGSVKAFYQKAATVSAINSTVTQAVSAIYAAMFTYNNTAYTTQPTKPGGGMTTSPYYYNER